jgi:hypothetical protein
LVLLYSEENKMKRVLLIVGGLSILGFGIYKYLKVQTDLLKQFTWSFKGFKIKTFTINEIAVELAILFKSKSNIEAKITNLYLDGFLDGKRVGYVEQTETFIIPANGSATIPIFISLNPKYVFNNIIDLSLGIAKNKDVRLTLDGYAKVESGFFKTTVPIKYDVSVKEYLTLSKAKP